MSRQPSLPSRRQVLTTGALALGAVFTVRDSRAALPAKAPGETRVITVVGSDFAHNGVMQEVAVRRILATAASWRIIVVRANAHFTPDLIADADLLIAYRGGMTEPIDLFTEPVAVDPGEAGVPLWSEANADAVIGRVETGMGFLALHGTLNCRNDRLTAFLGGEPIMHDEEQPVWSGYTT